LGGYDSNWGAKPPANYAYDNSIDR